MSNRRRVTRAVASLVGAACITAGVVAVGQGAASAATVTNPGAISVVFGCPAVSPPAGCVGSLALQGTTPITIDGINGTGSGTIDAAGVMTFPLAGLSFSPFNILVAGAIPAVVTIEPTSDWTGTLDPDTGVMTLHGPLLSHLADPAGAVPAFLGTDCPVGPLDLNLTSGTSGAVSGTPYSAGFGKVVDNNFTIPTTPDPNPTCNGANLINSGAPLPLAPGSATTTLTMQFTPAPVGSGGPPPTTGGGSSTSSSSSSSSSSTSPTTAGSTTTSTTTPSGPTFSVAGASVIEPVKGSIKMPFVITLSAPAATKVSVKYATTDTTAIQKLDYSKKRGSVSFSPGQTSKTVNVSIKSDKIPEPDETFFFDLSSPKGASILNGHAVGTIVDNGPVGVSIADAQISEPDRGSKRLEFTVSLTKAALGTVKVSYATSDGTATAPADYKAKHGTVSIKKGKTSALVKISVKGDVIVDPNEVFIVTLSNPVNALIADGLAIGTINDND